MLRYINEPKDLTAENKLNAIPDFKTINPLKYKSDQA